MSTAISTRKSFADRIDSLAAVFVSDRAVAVGRVIREAWWPERPAAQAGVTVGSTARADFTHDPAHDAGTASADTEANR